MTSLEESLEQLQKLVDYENGDYINIIFGNHWEVQFYWGKTLVLYETDSKDLHENVIAMVQRVTIAKKNKAFNLKHD